MRSDRRPSKKLFIVVQDYSPFRFSWESLWVPSRHDIVLLTGEKHYSSILESGEHRWFSRVVQQRHFDVESLRTTIEQVIAVHGVARDAVRVLCNDEDSIAAATEAAELLGVNGLGKEFVRKFKDKLVMKEQLIKKGVRIPRYLRWSGETYRRNPNKVIMEIEQTVGYPCFAKPSNGSGSVFTKKIVSPKELRIWCDENIGNEEYEIDEFISGVLYHCDSVIHDGVVIFTQVSRYLHSGHDFLLGKVDASLTVNLEDGISQRLASYTNEVLMALGLQDKSLVTHMEVFLPNDKRPVFLEVAARAPGGRVVPTYQRRLGCNFAELNFRLQMEMFCGLKITRGPYAGWAAFPSRKGIVRELNALCLQSPYTIAWRVSPGDELDFPRDVADYVAAVEVWNDELENLEEDMAKLSEWSPCNYNSA